MSKNEQIQIDGIITKVEPGDWFQVEVEIGDIKKVIRSKLSGKLRKNKIKLILGDKVTVSLSPYDLETGLVTWRYR